MGLRHYEGFDRQNKILLRLVCKYQVDYVGRWSGYEGELEGKKGTGFTILFSLELLAGEGGTESGLFCWIILRGERYFVKKI